MPEKTNSVALISEILETYEGRDKFLKTLSYAAKLATFFTKSPENSKKCTRFGSKMSECRIILRLMDDIPIIHDTITYGWGKKEPYKYTRFLNLLRNVVEIVSSPVEHICWIGEQKLVATDEIFWDNLSTRLWVICLFLSLLISLEKLNEINSKTRSRSSSDETREVKIDNDKWKNQLLTCLRLILDLSYAISYLPSSGSWGYHLKTWQVGLIGTFSSIIGIYQIFRKFNNRKK